MTGLISCIVSNHYLTRWKELCFINCDRPQENHEKIIYRSDLGLWHAHAAIAWTT